MSDEKVSKYVNDIEEQSPTGLREKQILKALKEKNNWFQELLQSHVRASGTLQALVDVIPAGVLVTDAAGNITFANPAAHEILGDYLLSNAFEARIGYTLHRPDGAVIPIDQLPLPMVLCNGVAIKNMEVLIRREQLELFVLVSATPTYDEHRQIVGAVSVFQDITAQKKVEVKLREDEETIRALFNAMSETICLIDKNDTILAINEAGEARLEAPKEQLLGKNIFSILPETVAKNRKAIVDEVFRTGSPLCFEDIRDGYLLENSVYPITNQNGEVVKLAITSKNITEQRHTSEALIQSEERFRTAFNNAAVGMVLVSLEGNLMQVNHSICEILGYSESELLGKHIEKMEHPDDNKENFSWLNRLKSREIPNFHIEKRFIHKHGAIITTLMSVSLILDSQGEPIYYIAQLQDITDRIKAEEALRQSKLEAENARELAESLANTDYLTGVLNRRAFMERFRIEFERSKRSNGLVSLILTDLDYFKKVNDTYGHLAGDLVLQKFTETILCSCRPYDFVGRFGGEEFTICLPSIDLDSAVKVADRMRKAVQALKIDIPGYEHPISITASFGVVAEPAAKADNIDLLMGQADTAMYKAKSEGRNRVCTLPLD